MSNPPQLWQAAVYLLIASACGAIAWRAQINDILRIILVLAAIFLAVMGIFLLVDWISHEFALRTMEIGKARVAAATAMSAALRGHPTDAREAISRQSVLQVVGIGGPAVIWSVYLSNGQKVDLDCLIEFLDATEERNNGYLFPVRNHSDARFRDFVNVEQQLTWITDEFLRAGWAEKAVGNQPARIKDGVTIGWIREMMGL